MNFKEMIVPFILAFTAAWAIQHFVLSRWLPTGQSTTEKSATFLAPQTESACKPLNTEVDFIDTENAPAAERTLVDTPWGQATFSTEGASLERLTFKRIIDGSEVVLSTVEPVAQTEKEQRFFLVALQDATPYYYDLVDKRDTDDQIQVTYEAVTDQVIVRKTFIVYKNVYKIDLKLSIEPQGDHAVTPRIFYHAPYMVEGAALSAYVSSGQRTFLGAYDAQPAVDIPSAVVITNAGVFEKIIKTSLVGHQGWYEPVLFGGDSRYFIHAMIADAEHFVQRAYYRQGAGAAMTSILEGPAIAQKTDFTLSFYVGPKEFNAVDAVDSRLEQTFDYSGIFAPISRLLLKILKALFAYLGNYGYAIIALTVLMKLLLFPFTYKSEQSMKQRVEMKKKLDYVQQKYKNDPEKLAQERAELLRKHGMPGLGGCLPLLLQIPMFIALSNVLRSSIELYKAPMLWIPDLSAADPYYILPIGVMLSMALQISGVDAQQRASGIAMALVFGAIATNFSAGLALYIFVSTLLGVLQNFVVRYFKLVN